MSANSAWAATYYVTATGSGTKDGTSLVNSFDVPAFNAASFNADDVIYFNGLAGNFTSAVIIPSGGSDASHLITYAGDPNSLPIINGGDTVATCISVATKNYIEIKDITITHCTETNLNVSGTSTGVIVRNITASYSGNQSFNILDTASATFYNITGNNNIDDGFSMHGGTAVINTATFSGNSNGIEIIQTAILTGNDVTITNSTNQDVYLNLNSGGLSASFTNLNINSSQTANNKIHLSTGGGTLSIDGGTIQGSNSGSSNTIRVQSGVISLSNITFSTTGNYPVFIGGTTSCALTGNTFSGTFTTSGITTSCTVTRNYFSGFTDHVLDVSASATINVYYNIFNGLANGKSAIVSRGSSILNAYQNVIYDSDKNGTGIYILGTMTAKQNIFYSLGTAILNAGGAGTSDRNIFNDNTTKTSGSVTNTNETLSDPLFIFAGTNFSLLATSTAIDSGTPISGLTTDYAGNSIYGLPDIGAYEYQPPYTFASYNIPTTGSARLYSDGKYRITVASTTSSMGNFSVTPLGGSYYTASTSQYMDITIDTWQTTGDKNKQWTATSTAGSGLTQATSTVYTIGDLAVNSYYQFKLDGSASTTAIIGATCTNGTCLTDSSGNLTFTYVGGYSTHTFGLEKDVTVPSAFTLTSPADNSSTSNSRPTLSWNASSDSESGLNKYQLYIDNVLDTDNISNSATSTTPTGALSCGSHTWYVRAIDNAGNASDSSSFTLKMVCEGTIMGSIGNFAPTPVYTIIPGMVSSFSVKQEETKNLSITNSVLTSKQKQEKISQIKKELIGLINQLLLLLRQKIETMQK